MQVTIELKLYATLQRFAPTDADRYSIEAGSSVERLIETLQIPMDQVKLMFRNGVKCGLGTLLKEGDRVGIFPPVGGG